MLGLGKAVTTRDHEMACGLRRQEELECIRWRPPVHSGGLMSLKWHDYHYQLTAICQRASDHDRRRVHALVLISE